MNYEPEMSYISVTNSSFSNLDYYFDESRNQPWRAYSYDGTGYAHYVKASALYLFCLDYDLTISNTLFTENRYSITTLQPDLSQVSGSNTKGGVLYDEVAGFLL